MLEMHSLFTLAQLDASSPEGWWWSTLSSRPALWMLALSAGCLVVLVFLAWRVRRVSVAARRPTIRQRLADDSGVAMMEFALVAPLILVVVLILIQAMLLFTGLFYVQYSAFAAARSAIVQIPTVSTEESNYILPVRGSDKFDAIETAAMLAVVPVCGREDGSRSQVVINEIVAGMHDLYQAQGKEAPNWVDMLLAQRINYAMNHTEVVLEKVVPMADNESVRFETVSGMTRFSDKEAIAARVRHEFALTVPLASKVFALTGSSGNYTPVTSNSDNPQPPGYWTLIEARAILTNEGINRNLPDPPPVQRR